MKNRVLPKASPEQAYRLLSPAKLYCKNDRPSSASIELFDCWRHRRRRLLSGSRVFKRHSAITTRCGVGLTDVRGEQFHTLVVWT